MQIPRWIEVAAAAVVVIGAAYAVIQFLADSTEELIDRSRGGAIEVSQVVLANGRIESRVVDDEFVQTDASTPQVDITVRNPSKESVLLTQARVTIEDSEPLPICRYFGGDAIPSSKDYALELPVLPLPSERVVVRPLHQEVKAGSVDRFRVLFKVAHPGLNVYLFAIRVELLTDPAQERVGVGHFVVSLPAPPVGTWPILPGGGLVAGVVSENERLPGTWCLRRNLAAVKRLLARTGKRSPVLDNLLSLQLADWWKRFADPRPASAVIEPLLRSSIGEAPVLAVFAAEQTGDQQLVKRTRKEASKLMLFSAEELLLSPYDELAGSATTPARYSWLLSPSQQAIQVLREAEGRQAVADTEAEEVRSDAID
jgi:hypothetical protein